MNMLKTITETPSKNPPLYISVIVFTILSMVFFPLLLKIIDIVVKNNEMRVTENVVARSENLLMSEINRVTGSLGDWSSWNDTYQFAQDENLDFVINNLMDNTFSNLDINAIIILNTKGEIIFEKYFDTEIQRNTPSPIDYDKLISAYPELIIMDEQSTKEGFINNQGFVMIAASKPILTSLEEGPPRGTMIFLKSLDQYSLAKISDLAMNTINLYSIPEVKDKFSAFPDRVDLEENFYLLSQGKERISGFKYITDIQQNSTLVLEAENTRDLFHQGRTTKLFVSGILLLLITAISWMAYEFTKSMAHAKAKEEAEVLNKRLLEESRVNAILLEKRVLERTRELELRNKEQETFNYSVSHDLRSPLRGISGYASILLKDHSSKMDESAQTFLGKIIDTTKRMDKLINDLLAYTRAEVVDEEKSLVDLEVMCNEILQDYEIDRTKIHIIKKFECMNIQVNRQSVKVILDNLIDNAIKFTRDVQSPEIFIGSTRQDVACLLTIKDNGIGFDMNYGEKIFEIFQRLHLPEEYPGTGVGLALVKKAIDRLGGRITVKSKIGEGTTFTVIIPMEKESQLTLLE